MSPSPYALADGSYCAADYQAASDCLRGTDKDENAAESVLRNFYRGSVDFAVRDYVRTVTDFSAAETGLKEQDGQCLLGKGLGIVRDVSTESSGAYLATTYDETMVNLYQALSFLAQGDIDRARVEFNRVDARQGRAAVRNSEMIKKRQACLEKMRTDKRNVAARNAVSDVRFTGGNDLEEELKQWNAYADYMNPAAVFMCGAFLMLWGEDAADCEMGLTYFKRAYGMQPTAVTQACAKRMEDKANARGAGGDCVLVLFENGMGPQKVEERREMVIPYRYPIHVGIALPMLRHRPQAHASLSVFDGNDLLGSTESICELDRVIAAEFREELGWIKASAVLGACIRVGTQIVAMEALRADLDRKVNERKMSPWERDVALMAAGNLLSAASKVMTHADTRIWSLLPKEYQAVLVHRPASGTLIFKSPGGDEVAHVALPEGRGSAFVYVKIPTPTSPAIAFTVPAR